MRTVILAFMIVVTPFLVGFGPQGLSESTQGSRYLYADQVPLVGSISEPAVTAQAAVAIDDSSGQILYEKDAHVRRAPASMTKVTTAIVALENGDIDEAIKVTVDGWSMEGSSIMGLKPGPALSLKDLLWGLLLPSGNDAALQIAEHVGGSVESFASMMNAKVSELGLENTHFVNPHGLHHEDHYSSAFDIAQLARHAMGHAAFTEIVKTQQMTVATQGLIFNLNNTNPLLGVYPGVDGVKTGYTEEAGYCVVASATRDGRRVFVTLMDSAGRVEDGSALFDYAFDSYRSVPLGLSWLDSPLYRYQGPGGQSYRVELAANPEVCLPLWQAGDVWAEVKWLADAEQVAGPGETVGEVVFYPGDLPEETIPLVLVQ